MGTGREFRGELEAIGVGPDIILSRGLGSFLTLADVEKIRWRKDSLQAGV
jgi:hypothetical protein